MEQLHAGYFPEAITKMYSDSDKALSVKNLMNMLSYFDADFIASKTPVSVSEDVDNIAKTGLNLLSSKLPSLPTVELEKYFAKTHLRTKDVSNSKNIHFDFKHTHESYNELKDAIYKALHIVDPRLRKEDVINHNRTWENIAGEFEKDFAQLIVPAYTKECFNQFFHFTRPYNSLVKKAKQHKQEAVDFAIEIPYSNCFRSSIVGRSNNCC